MSFYISVNAFWEVQQPFHLFDLKLFEFNSNNNINNIANYSNTDDIKNNNQQEYTKTVLLEKFKNPKTLCCCHFQSR